MRRFTSFAGVMLLALFVSGWGSALAASFCPHLAGKQLTAAMTGDHCGREGAGQADHSASHQQAMKGMEMTPAPQQRGDRETVTVGQLSGTCAHCLGQERSPVTAVAPRASSPQKHDAGAFVEES